MFVFLVMLCFAALAIGLMYYLVKHGLSEPPPMWMYVVLVLGCIFVILI